MLLLALLLATTSPAHTDAIRVLAAQCGVKPDQLVWSVDAQGHERADITPKGKPDNLSFAAVKCMLEGAQKTGLRVGFISQPPPRTKGEAKTPTWPCSWVHGRMTVGNGTPATRIWPVGTHRMLGVVNAEHPIADDANAAAIPANARKLLTPEHHFTLWGDFFVCPVTPERAGWLRFVIVKKARRLFVEPK